MQIKTGVQIRTKKKRIHTQKHTCDVNSQKYIFCAKNKKRNTLKEFARKGQILKKVFENVVQERKRWQ